MKRLAPFPLLAVLSLAVSACARPPAPAVPSCTNASAEPPRGPLPKASEPDNDPPVPSTFDVDAIDAWVAHQLKKRGLVGVSVGVLREGKVVLAKGYGRRSVATGEPVTAETSFGIGSVTKQLTCASVLLLAEAGKLSIEDKVAKWYPDLTRAKDVSLRDVMAHVAGYPDYYPLDYLDERMIQATTPDAVIAEYGKRPLDFEPHARFSYSNTGFLVAGRVVEKLSGDPFAVFVDKRIFKPLGMKRSGFDPKAIGGDVAVGHTAFALGEATETPREAEGWLHAAGGAWASATDLLTWDLALVDRKVLKARSYETMTTPPKLEGGNPTTYACGIGSWQRGGEPMLGHSGAVSGFLAYNTVFPRTRSAVVLLSNADHIDAGALHDELVNILAKSYNRQKIPTIAGPPTKEAALELFRQMQKGTIDRSRLAPSFSLFLTDARLKAAAPALAALGEPTSVDVESVAERGGAESAVVKLRFASSSVRANLHRSPDGKVLQFLLSRP